MAKIIDGKAISLAIKDELKEKVAEYKNKGIDITLAVVKVGNDPASAVYVRNKEKACEYVGINSRTLALPEETTQEELLNIVRELNEDDTVNGILVQLPLPKHIDESEILLAINSTKDVDGFHPVNVGKMVIGEDTFLPCTPAGIIEMLKRSDIDIAVSGGADFDELLEKVEELPTLYSVDLLNMDTCRNDLLMEDIKQYGREIYKKI